MTSTASRGAAMLAAWLCAWPVACSKPPQQAVESPVHRLNSEGFRRFERGEADAAEESFHAALREAELVDDLPGQGESWNNLGALAFARGDLAAATSMHLAALRLYETCQPRVQGEVRARSNLGMALMAAGRTLEARAQFDTAVRLAAHVQAPALGLLAQAGLAAVELKEARPEQALQRARNAAEQAAARGDNEARGAALLVEGEALYALGKHQQANASLLQALAIDRSRRVPFAIAEDLRALHKVSLALGRKAEAAAYMLRCARISRAMGQLELAEDELSTAALLLRESGDPSERVQVQHELQAIRRVRAAPAPVRPPFPTAEPDR